MLLSSTSKVFATGIMAPAGLGFILIFMLAIGLLGILITFFTIRKIYKNSNNKVKTKKNIIRFFMAQFLIGFFVYYVWIPGYVSFTRYTIIDNNPLENHLEIKLQHSFYYFELSDGNTYEFKKKYRNESERNNFSLKTGQLVMLSDENNDVFTLNSIDNSNEYSRYLRTIRKAIFTIPLSFKKIKKNQKQYEGTIQKVTDDWVAKERHLVLAIDSDYCCDIAWIKKLLKHGVNNKKVINKMNLLHRIFHLNNTSYYQYRTEIFTEFFRQSKVDVNQVGYSKQTILHKAIRIITNKHDNTLQITDRNFIRLLLDSGVDQNTADNSFETPLIYAINSKNFQLAHLLLDNGAHFARRYANRESARELVKRSIAEANIKYFPTKETVKQLKSLLSAMKKIHKEIEKRNTRARNIHRSRNMTRTSSWDTENKTDKSIFPILSELKQDCDTLGKSWEKSYGIKVDKLTDSTPLTEQEKKQIKPIKNQFQRLGITAFADYTCMYKGTPLNTVTVKVFVFKNTRRALNWWERKYQYNAWEKHYTKTTNTPYLAVDSKQLTKRAMLFNNLWITTHHLKTGKEHIILLGNILNKLRGINDE